MTELADLHCHLLPGIDDGAQTEEDSAALLKASVESGVTRFVFTPHFYPEHMTPEVFLQNRARACEKIAGLKDSLGYGFRCGAEIAYTPMLDRLPLEQLAFSESRYFLLELNFFYEPPGVENAIRNAVERGLIPILAHIERFPYIRENPKLLYQWVRAGALTQVNAGWALRERSERKRLLQYADWNLVHLMASDAHSMERRPPRLREGYEALPEALAEYMKHNAAAVYENQMADTMKPVSPTLRFGRWH